MSDTSSNPFVDAANAGLSPIPVDTTTKRPKVAWKTYQESPADLLQLHDWANENIGIVCGQVSGRLICLDFEAGFMSQMSEMVQRLKDDECYATFYQWVGGYCEETARGGMHVLVRLEGDGPTEGNRKLAMASATEVLIETRGEGGYVVVAPSMNGERGWKLLHGGFDRIAYATLEEWRAVEAVLRTFDTSLQKEAAPTPTVESRSTPSLSPILRDSWIEGELARLNIRTELSARGWEPAGSHDQYGEHWVRPNKDARLGHSASISENDRLFVHSTNAGLPVGNPSLDALDVILGYELGRRPTPDERVAYLRARRPDRPGGEAIEGRADQAADPTNPSLYLPEDFWQHADYPWLGMVREAAMRRMISPDAVLGALLSAYATTIPMGIRLPAIVGNWAPLNLYSVLVSRSGGGKTSAIGLADQLLGPVSNPDIVFRSLRSGEGLINLACRKVGKDEPPAYRCGVQIAFDEGGVLSRQTERSGSTTIPYLNTAWAGHGMVGGAKASEDGFFPADLVRISAVIGVQFGAAANLFMGESQVLGFPQRLTFYGLDHPDLLSLSRVDSDFSPIKALGLPMWQHSEFTRDPHEMTLPDEIADEVWNWTRSKHGSEGPAALDGHMMQIRLRLASVLALASGRGDVNLKDWDLASKLENTSRSLRQALLASLGDVTKERARAAGTADATRQIARDDVFLERAAVSFARKVQSASIPLSIEDAKSHLRSFKRRHGVAWQDARDIAMRRGWVLSTGEQSFESGPVKVGGSGGS